MRTHQARLGGSTRSSSCASNPNVAHASLRGKQMPAEMTYSGVALNERGPSFRNPTPTIRKNSCNEPPRKEAADPRCNAQVLPLAPVPIKTTPSAYRRDTAHPSTHLTLTPVHTRLFVMGGHGELKLLCASHESLPNSELHDSDLSRMVHKFGTFPLGKGRRPELVCR